MEFSSNIGAKLRDHKRSVAALLGATCIALAAFFVGAWAGSSGLLVLTAGAGKVAAQSAPAAPSSAGPMHAGMGCCGNNGGGHPMATTTPETPSPSHQMPGGEQMPGQTHPGDMHQMPGGEQMPGSTHPSDAP